MIAAFNTLRRDAWVLGIACAAALAYAVVSFLESAVGFVLQLVEGQPVYRAGPDAGPGERDLIELFEPPFTFVVGDHYVHYGQLLGSAVILIITIVVVAFVLHATRDSAGQGENGTM